MKGARGGLASVRPPMAGARWLALRQCWRGGGEGCAAVAGLGVCWERAGADANGPLGLWILVFPSFRLPSASRCLK